MGKRILSILVFFIIVIILFGTFLIFSFLLEKKETNLMSKTGTIELSNSFVKSNANDISLVNIIQNSLNSFYSIPISHKPFENQLSKEEALKVYKSTVTEFIKKGIILDIPNIEEKIENEENFFIDLETRSDDNYQFDPSNSTWSILYRDDKFYIYMRLNAITGYVLRLSVIYADNEEELINNTRAIEEILELYLEYLKLDDLKTEIIKNNENEARCKLSGTNIYLVVNKFIECKNYNLRIDFTSMVQ